MADPIVVTHLIKKRSELAGLIDAIGVDGGAVRHDVMNHVGGIDLDLALELRTQAVLAVHRLAQFVAQDDGRLVLNAHVPADLQR